MEVGTEPATKRVDKETETKALCKLTVDDLLLLVDLFYLPYHHGTRAKNLIAEFKWLKNSAIKEDTEAFQELTEQEQKAKVLYSKNGIHLNLSLTCNWRGLFQMNTLIVLNHYQFVTNKSL